MARVDRRWALRNLGPAAGDVASSPVARARSANGPAPLSEAVQRSLQRDLIDFDSDSPALIAFAARAPRTAATLASYVTPKWPKGLAPTPGARPTGASLPRADVLIVTWTMDEGHALARVLTPGFDSKTDWKPYTKNYKAIAAQMRATCPARQYGRLGTYWTTMIGKKRVTLFKSDSHMSQDGPKLPNKAVWEQIIADCKPELVITRDRRRDRHGRAGGRRDRQLVRQLRLSTRVRELQRADVQVRHIAVAQAVRERRVAVLGQRAVPACRQPATAADHRVGEAPTGIVTTDFFGFDNSSNTYGLQGKGDLSEMGDAVLGLACKELGAAAPTWVIVRNVSDPQIDSTRLTLSSRQRSPPTSTRATGAGAAWAAPSCAGR